MFKTKLYEPRTKDLKKFYINNKIYTITMVLFSFEIKFAFFNVSILSKLTQIIEVFN